MANSPNKTFDSLVNLLDRFDKRRKNHDVSSNTLMASSSNPGTPSSSNTSASSSFTSSNIFNNLNFSFNNKNLKEGLSSIKQRSDPKTLSDSNLVVIDDDEYDDPSDAFGPQNVKTDIKCESKKQTIGLTGEASNKITTSSSLYKLGSQVFEDMSKNNPSLSHVVDEAESLRQRFVVKKKALDITFDNFSIKNKIKHDSSSPESSLKVSNMGLKATQSDIDIQKTDLESNFITKTDDMNANIKTSSSEETKRQSPIPEPFIADERPFVKLSSVSKSSDHENEHQIKTESSLNEMKSEEKLQSEAITKNVNTNNMQINSKKNEDLGSSNIDNSTAMKIKVPKEKLTTQNMFSRTIYAYKHLLLPIMVLLFAYAIIMPRKWHYFTLTYSFGILNGILLAGLILFALIKLELIDHVINFLKSKDETEKVLDTEIENKKANFDDKSRFEMNQQIHSLLIQSAIFKENKSFDGIYKGWMNELREVYTPDNYFLNKTRSVFINLDGTMLRLQTTNSKVPKRAVCNEKIVCTFNKFRIYDLTGCKVQILPSELCRKRYWAKKYPLCLSGVKLVSSSSTQYKPIQTPANHNMHNKLASSISVNSVNSIADSTASGDSNLPMSPTTQTISKDGTQLESDTLILFARTDREKEEWFKLFNKSSAKKLQDSNHFSKLNEKRMQLLSTEKKSASTSIVSNNINLATMKKDSENSDSVCKFSYSASNDKIIYHLSELKPTNVSNISISNTTEANASLVNANNQTENDQPGTEPVVLVETNTQTESGLIYDSSLAFMNTFLIRLFADFFEHKYWISKIQTKMQNKLNTIKLPYFMEGLNIINLDLGSVVPLIKQASEPWYDEKGLWVHLDLDYSGGVQILISTKLNLMKLKANSCSNNTSQSTYQSSANAMFSFKNDSEQSVSSSLDSSIKSQDEQLESSFGEHSSLNCDFEKQKSKRDRPAIIDSEAEDSPESSGDEYTHSDFSLNENNQASTNSDDKLVETANTSKKLLNLVSKIAASNYFQKATENKYIKMAMENVSNCQLNLNVEVNKINGKLALNIPPHPSDRIWYGFVEKPQMTLVATPQVGEKEVSYAAISDWIADKLKQEFQKVLVFPNMDDFYIPILNSEVNFQNW